MARGGYRPGAGRPKGKRDSKPRKCGKPETITTDSITEKLEPLEYMLQVMNDPKADVKRRDTMAIAAAPFYHVRADRKPKKDDRNERAKVAAKGRFAPAAPPSLTLIKKGEN